MSRIALAFVAGLALGLGLMGWQPWGKGGVATTVSDTCEVAVHLNALPGTGFGC